MRTLSLHLLAGLVAAVAPAIVAPSMALAAPSGPVTLDSTIKLDKVVTENGQSRHELVAPQKVVPGNHLVFETTYHNTGKQGVDHFVVTNPVPAAVALETDATDAFDVSVDGGKTWGKLSELKVTGPNGAGRAAQAADVTHVRWVLPAIAPGATGTLDYHAVVR
ncbi:hypothetical protein [Novosphingobium nitrogenifigens]|nr:hypothetical protein [Novosphingobium nitrogenifigens]